MISGSEIVVLYLKNFKTTNDQTPLLYILFIDLAIILHLL